jgi:hypothetical protein
MGGLIMDELTKDMCNLAKMLYDISMKHGDIYLNVSKSAGYHVGCTTEINKKYSTIEYWGNTNIFTKNLKEKIK